MLRFALLENIGEGEEQVVLEWTEPELVRRIEEEMMAQLVPYFMEEKRIFKNKKQLIQSFGREEIVKAFRTAWSRTVSRFKNDSVRYA